MLAGDSGSASAAGELGSVELGADAREYSLTGHVEFLEDETGELTLEQITSDSSLGWFEPDRPDPNYGFTSSTYWLRFEVVNSTSTSTYSILTFPYPLLDHIDGFVEQLDGTFVRRQMGDRISFVDRVIPHTRPSMTLITEPGQRQRVFVRIKSQSSMQIGVELRTYDGFIAAATKDQLWHGIYYGIMLVMGLYNLFLFVAIRNIAYLTYVIFVAMFTLLQLALDGVAIRYLFPDTPAAANLFVPLIVCLAQIPVMFFTQQFLETRRQLPRVHMLLYGFAGVLTFGVVLALVAPYAVAVRFAVACSLITSLLSEAVGVATLVKGYRPARFFVLAWTALIIGTILYVLMTIGVLPSNEITVNIQRIGSALEVTFLSFALADRFKLIEGEAEKARAQALALERDMALTGAVQQLFLPKQDRFDDGDISLAGFYRPADRCGGDWWWYEARPNGGVSVLLGDVTGHGAGAAMMTGAVATAYGSLPVETRQGDLGVMVRALGERFTEIAGATHRMSILALDLDPARGRMVMWSAGAPAVFTQRASGEVTPLLARGSLMGDEVLELGVLDQPLEPGDRVFAFSDGLPELIRPNGRQLGYRGVERILTSTRDLDLERARNAIEEGLDEQRGGVPQHDDISFVLIEYRGREAARAA